MCHYGGPAWCMPGCDQFLTVWLILWICSGKSKSSKLVASGKQREHVRSSSRVQFVGLTPSEPSSPTDHKPTTTTTTTTPTTPVPAGTDNGQLHLHHSYQHQEPAAVNSTDTLRPVQTASVAGTMRRTLYSPRYTSDGQLKHCLTTTTNAVLSTQQ